MNLFYTINDAFAPQLGAAICSVCENNKCSDEIRFFIGALNIKEENQALLRTIVDRYNREITFFPIDNLKDRLGFDFDTGGWNEVILARLLVGSLLPPDVERVIYLDGDTIVIGDLQALWETDMGGKPLGASIEPTANHARKASLGLSELPYFNSGVLLIDLKVWRQQNTAETIFKFYQKAGANLFAADQDAINGALAGNIFVLSPKYNYYNIFWYYPYKTLVKIEKPAPYISEDVFLSASSDPRIIHYLGEDRPWRKGNTHRYSAEYQRYLQMTPWKDTPMEEGWELYFKLYKAFWMVLKPFPMLQYHMIDKLIPLVMKHRKRKLAKPTKKQAKK